MKYDNRKIQNYNAILLKSIYEKYFIYKYQIILNVYNYIMQHLNEINEIAPIQYIENNHHFNVVLCPNNDNNLKIQYKDNIIHIQLKNKHIDKKYFLENEILHSFGIALFGYDYKNINIEHLFSTSNLNEYAQNICNYMKIHKNENLNYFQLIEKVGCF